MEVNLAYHYDAWLKTALGRALFLEERKIIWRFLQNFQHDFWLQIGGPTDLTLKELPTPTEQFLLLRRIYLSNEMVTTQFNPGNKVVSNLTELPFREEKFNSVFLWHSLETSEDKRKTIKEVSRVLKPNGIVVIISFNPFSLFSFRNKLLHHQNSIKEQKILKKSSSPSATRLNWWLQRSSLRILHEQKIFFRPPISDEKFLRKTFFLEAFGAMFAELLGNINVVVAQKKVIGVTPLLDPKALLREIWPIVTPSRSNALKSNRSSIDQHQDH